MLGAFRPGEGALRNADIAARVGLPKATVSRLTCSLWKAGYLEYDQRSGDYALAGKVLTLGFTVLSNQRILPAAHEQMRRLANQSGCTVSLATPDGHAMIYLDRCTGETMPYFLGIGSATEMVRTAGGRAYIAGLSDASRRELYARLASLYTDEWRALLPALEAACDQVRTRGFCLVDEEWRRDTRAIAAPLVSRSGDSVLSINCACPGHFLSASRLVRVWGPRLDHLAKSLSLQF